MNLVADLLGFYDDSPDNRHLYRAIWSDRFGHLFPGRLQVSYGSGKEFRADKEWAHKKEANVMEALIGALHKAQLGGLAVAAVTLCFACSVVWPPGVIPSNWYMAEKVMKNGVPTRNDFMLQLLDVDGLTRGMEKSLNEGGR